jgi:CDP-diacylglycerol--glycerol-3-phosphate 3-phosphatidyltransferase
VNLPNTITTIRLFLVPVFIYLCYAGSEALALAGLGVFVVASLSDSLDGYLARKNGLVTKLGQFLDPLADKILVIAALVVLVDQRMFPLWAALVILLREAAVQLLRNRIVAGGGTLPASAAAKAKTVLQIVMVSWWLVPWDPNPVHWVLLAAALLATIWSGAEYFARHSRSREVPS